MAGQETLYVAFLWHMHQPFYKDLVTGEYVLPWVRLHAIKDYYDMVAMLDKFPGLKQNFNLVPSLLLQIEDYVYGKVSDNALLLSKKPAAELTEEERVKILREFFMANWDTMIRPYPRYQELLIKRGRFVPLPEIVRVAKKFSVQEMLDLQVWFNLAWCGNACRQPNLLPAELIKKDRNFTEEDKMNLLAQQQELMSRIIPKYKEVSDRDQIELSTTPFYHPILPLLCDNNIARVASPDIFLPERKFSHPENAEAQVELAVRYHQERFGKSPEGMWPSEGSVSEDIVPIIARHGIKWIATDEGILRRSLEGQRASSAELYRPYSFEKDGQFLNLVFRNRHLSDLIGFTYSRWKGEEAAQDLIRHLHHIRLALPEGGGPYLVSIILDGENAWEYYPHNGRDFLNSLYDYNHWRIYKKPSAKRKTFPSLPGFVD